MRRLSNKKLFALIAVLAMIYGFSYVFIAMYMAN